MLHAKLSNIHILQGTLPTYLTTHTYLQSIFATYPIPHTYLQGIFATHLLRFEWHFCYMFTFHSHICSYIWDATSCYIFAHVYTHLKTILCRTFIEKAIFVLLIHILERQFHIICSYFEKHFRAIFYIYAHLQSIWLPIQHTHVHGEQHFHTI